ncbi:hypothetical protein [Peptoniphilus senegalensis]
MPNLIALSRAMIIAIAPSSFSVDFSLSAFMFLAGSVRIKIFYIIHLRTG